MCYHLGTTYQVTLPPEIWCEWEARAITQVIEKRAFVLKPNKGFQIRDWHDPALPVTRYIAQSWITTLFPDPSEFQGYFWKFGIDESTIINWLYQIIFDSPTTRQGIKDQIVLLKQQLKNKIRVQVDQECGMPVQFASNEKSPSVLYYTYGSELYMVKDILYPDFTVVKCGTFSE